MIIRVIDFDKVLSSYKNYHVSIKKINDRKLEFSNSMDKIKSEMESIIASSKSFLLDDATKLRNQNRFREIQSEAIEMESVFRNEIVELQNQELENNFSEISDIVKKWSEEFGADLILNKNSTLYFSHHIDSTDLIINRLKQLDLFEEVN